MSRWLFVLVIAGLMGAGLAYDQVASMPLEGRTVNLSGVGANPSVTDPPRVDAAWYCPIGSSSPDGYADHTLDITNLSADPAVATVNILTEEGRGPTTRVDVAPFSASQVQLSDYQASAVAGAVVEVVGGQSLVGHTVMTAQGEADGPCATGVASEWYFANGRTEADSTQYIALMNPFPEDAVYDMTIAGPGRVREGQFVPGRSVRLIRVDEVRVGEEIHATKIVAQTGRLVVERLQLVDGVMGPAGVSLQMGVPNLAGKWYFPAGRVTTDGNSDLSIYNPAPSGLEILRSEGQLEADTVEDAFAIDQSNTAVVEVELWPTNPSDRALYGTTVIEREVPPGGIEVIDLVAQAERFEFPVPYELGVSVTSLNDVEVVAEHWQSGKRFESNIRLDDEEADTEDATTDDTTTDDANTDDTTTDDTATDDTATDDTTTDGAADNEAGTESEVAGDAGSQPLPTDGLASSAGTSVLSDRWFIPWLPIEGDSSVIAVLSNEEAIVKVQVMLEGAMDAPIEVTVPAQGRALIPITRSTGGGAAVAVESSVPVAVEGSVVVEGDVSFVSAVPTVR